MHIKSLEGHTRTEDYPGGKSRQGRRGQAWRMAVKSHLVLFSLVFPFYTKKTQTHSCMTSVINHELFKK